MAKISNVLPTTLEREGGYVYHDKDFGGSTNKGVTLNTYRRFFGASKTVEDLKNITDAEVTEIYKRGYFDKIKGSEINSQNMAIVIFDFAVIAGYTKAAKLAQYVANIISGKNSLSVDGKIGALSLDVFNRFDVREIKAFVLLYMDVRRAYHLYRVGQLTINDAHYLFVKELTTVNTGQDVFIRGWLNRVDIIQESLYPNIKKKPCEHCPFLAS